MPDPILHAGRLDLRPLRLEDASVLFAAFSDPEAMRFWTTAPHASIDETREHLEREMVLQGAHVWAICLRGSDEAIGLVNFLGETRLPGMGYFLRRDHWGRSIMPEACRAVLAYGFDALHYDRVELWIDEANLRSQRVAEKLGFRLRGQLIQRYPHRPHPHVTLVYGLWAYEWRGEAGAAADTRFLRCEPVLAVKNVSEAAAFYRDRLGFEINYLFGDPPTHAAVSGGWSGSAVTIQLSEATSVDRQAAPTVLYIFVAANVDELCSTYRARQVEIVQEPATLPWGLREFGVRDLDGHILRFGAPA